jgi:flagellar hook-length control protein FliK
VKTQNVIAQTANLFSNSKVNSSSTDKQKKTTNDFSNLINENLKSKNDSGKQTEKVNNYDGKNSKDSKIGTTLESKAKELLKDSNSKIVSNDNESDLSVQMDETQSIDEVEANVIKSVEELMVMLQNTVCDTLGISKEELEKTMETLGLTMVDLLNPEKLTMLALKVNASDDITAVLTNESLANTIKDLTQNVDELVKTQDLNLTKDEIVVIMDELHKESSPMNQQNVNQNIEETTDNSQSVDQNDTVVEVHNLKGEFKKQLSNETNDSNSTETQNNDSNQNEAEINMKSPLDAFIQNLSIAGNDTNTGFTEQISNLRQMQEITNQIVEQIKVFIKPDQTSMELQLNPESLGKINLSVVSKDGVITAQFTAQNEIAKEAIESQMHTLRESLNNQGLKVESIEVTVSNFDFGQSNQAANGGKSKQGNSQRRNFIEDENNTVASLESESDLDNLLEQSSNSIDYSA